MNDRQFTAIDRFLIRLDEAVRTINTSPARGSRPYPAEDVDEIVLSGQEKTHAANLMRVNHAGEIAAQGLYQGHAVVARDPNIEAQMRESADEELDHLAWCEKRLDELGSSPSRLRPIWYGGAFAMGVASGILGDKWSLGFIEETERQVSDHLSSHLNQLPENDHRSRKIVRQMRDEEEAHGAKAHAAGAAALPAPITNAMRAIAKIMTTVAYRW